MLQRRIAACSLSWGLSSDPGSKAEGTGLGPPGNDLLLVLFARPASLRSRWARMVDVRWLAPCLSAHHGALIPIVVLGLVVVGVVGLLVVHVVRGNLALLLQLAASVDLLLSPAGAVHGRHWDAVDFHGLLLRGSRGRRSFIVTGAGKGPTGGAAHRGLLRWPLGVLGDLGHFDDHRRAVCRCKAVAPGILWAVRTTPDQPSASA
eukprot:1214159-Alexandrium_andersonii.AAC.3